MTSLKSGLGFKLLVPEAITSVMFHPFLPSICFLCWALFRLSGNSEAADHYHFLAKTSSGIHGTFEARMNFRFDK